MDNPPVSGIIDYPNGNMHVIAPEAGLAVLKDRGQPVDQILLPLPFSRRHDHKTFITHVRGNVGGSNVVLEESGCPPEPGLPILAVPCVGQILFQPRQFENKQGE